MSEKKGFWTALFGGHSGEKSSGGCCNMKIVEEEKGSCCNMKITEIPSSEEEEKQESCCSCCNKP